MEVQCFFRNLKKVNGDRDINENVPVAYALYTLQYDV